MSIILIDKNKLNNFISNLFGKKEKFKDEDEKKTYVGDDGCTYWDRYLYSERVPAGFWHGPYTRGVYETVKVSCPRDPSVGQSVKETFVDTQSQVYNKSIDLLKKQGYYQIAATQIDQKKRNVIDFYARMENYVQPPKIYPEGRCDETNKANTPSSQLNEFCLSNSEFNGFLCRPKCSVVKYKVEKKKENEKVGVDINKLTALSRKT